MRFPLLVLSLGLLVAPGFTQETVEPSSQVPGDSPLSVRIQSLDRADAVVKEWIPILKAFGLQDEIAPFEQVPLSNWLFAASGLNGELVDRSKPVHIAVLPDDEVVFVLAPGAGATWEGNKELQMGMTAARRGGAVVVGRTASLGLAVRGAPTRYLDGDVALHVYLSDLTARNKENIEQGAAMAAMQAGAAPDLPDAVRAFALPMIGAMKDAVFSVESFDYAATWKGGRIETEGLLTVKPRTGLRALLQRAGAPGAHDLAAYLPKDALLTFTVSLNPDWPAKELGAMLDRAAGGEGEGAAIQRIFAMTSSFSDSLTGRSAGAMTMGGMMMGGSFAFLYELKEGADVKALAGKLEVESVNSALKKFGLPASYSLEKAVTKHGETELHRMTMQSENPMLAMQLAMYQTYFAFEGSYLFVAMSPTGEDDIKALIDRVRSGDKVENPHQAAMARLGRAHNLGFTWNLGALKPMAMMVGMFGAPPEVAQAMQNLPDTLLISTAVTFDDGNLRWRGDWPVEEVAKIARSLQKAQEDAAKPTKKKDDEDY